MASYKIYYGISSIDREYEIEADSEKEAEQIAKENIEQYCEESMWYEAEEIKDLETYEIHCSTDGRFQRQFSIAAESHEEAENEARHEYRKEIIGLIEVT